MLASLARVRQLKGGAAGGSELLAVQELYWQPRADLAALGFLFPDLADADRHLIQHGDEHARWHYFQHAFVLARKRCRVIAEHLARHADPHPHRDQDSDRDGDRDSEHREHEAFARLAGPEIAARRRERRDRTVGAAGRLAAAAHLAASHRRCVRRAAGLVRHRPDHRVFGALTASRCGARPPAGSTGSAASATAGTPRCRPCSRRWTRAPRPATDVTVKNGLAFSDERDELLGGAQGHTVSWSGVLLIEHGGRHRFAAGAPTPEGRAPRLRTRRALRLADPARARPAHLGPAQPWLVRPAEHRARDRTRPAARRLHDHRGVPAPGTGLPADRDDLRRQHTGFQLKYAGPDTGEELVTVPRTPAVHRRQDRTARRRPGFDCPGRPSRDRRPLPVARLRDIRRTYQRAFLALRLTDRFELSARRHEDGQSELGYLIDHPDRFAGAAFGRDGGGFAAHPAWFDLDFLPVTDPYLPPTASRGPAGRAVARPAGRAVRLVGAAVRLHPPAPRERAPRPSAPRRPVAAVPGRRRGRSPADVLQLAPHLRRRTRPQRPGADLRRAASAAGRAGADRRRTCSTSAGRCAACTPSSGPRAVSPPRRRADRQRTARAVGRRRSLGRSPVRQRPAHRVRPGRHDRIRGPAPLPRPARPGRRAAGTGPARAAGLPVRHGPGAAALAGPGVRGPAAGLSPTCCCSTSRPGLGSGPAGSRTRSPPSRRSCGARGCSLEPGVTLPAAFLELWDGRFASFRLLAGLPASRAVPGERDRVVRTRGRAPRRGLPVPGARAARPRADHPGPGRDPVLDRAAAARRIPGCRCCKRVSLRRCTCRSRPIRPRRRPPPSRPRRSACSAARTGARGRRGWRC